MVKSTRHRFSKIYINKNIAFSWKILNSYVWMLCNSNQIPSKNESHLTQKLYGKTEKAQWPKQKNKD